MTTIKAVSNVTVASELFAVLEEKKVLEKREEALREQLLQSLQEQGVGFVRLDNGTSFTRSHRETLKVLDENAAREWAENNYCVKIDTTKAMKILRREMAMPACFERKIGADYLTVKKGGEAEDDE